MADNDSNLLQFPHVCPGHSRSREFLELMAGITSLLRAAEQVSLQLRSTTELNHQQKLVLIGKISAIVAEGASLYLALVDDADATRAIHSKVETLMSVVNKT